MVFVSVSHESPLWLIMPHSYDSSEQKTAEFGPAVSHSAKNEEIPIVKQRIF
jgi:hypothetical protein